MKTFLGIMGAGCMLAFMYLCITLGIAVHAVEKHLSTTIMAAGDTLAKVNLELDEMHRLTLEAGLTAMEARKASAKEAKYLDVWNSQIANTLKDVQGVMVQTRTAVASIQGTSGAATEAIQATQQTIADLQPTIAQATATLKTADAQLSDPHLTATLTNLDSATSHINATSADIQTVVQGYLHPTWARRIYGWTLDIAHALNPL